MTFQHKKKVVWITGASSGIGRITAKLLVKHNYIIYASDNRSKNLDDLDVLGIYIIKIDPSNDTDIQSAIDEIIAKHGRIDLLINLAGFTFLGTSEDLTTQETEYQLRSSLWDWERLIALSLPYMKKEKTGKIINIVSTLSQNNIAHHEDYNRSRKFVRTLNIKIKERSETSGVSTIIIDATTEPENNRMKNQNYSSYLFSKFFNQMEAVKVSILKKMMISGQEDEILAHLLLEYITTPKRHDTLERKFRKVFPLFFREMHVRKKVKIVKMIWLQF